MAINETISKGNKYRRLKDAANKVWQRISFWTAASDVEFDNGTTLQNSLGSVTGITDSLTSTSSTVAASAAAVASLNSKITSFQDGVTKLYNKMKELGVTPSGTSLDDITNAIGDIYESGRKNSLVYNLGGVTSSNIAGLFPDSYKTMTTANFAIVFGAAHAGTGRDGLSSGGGNSGGSISPYVTYTAETGTVIVNNTSWSGGSNGNETYISSMSVSFNLYVFANAPVSA